MLIQLPQNAVKQIVWSAAVDNQGRQKITTWIVANRDPVNQIRIGYSDATSAPPDLASPDNLTTSLVDPLASVQVSSDRDWFAVNTAATAVQLDLIQSSQYWSPSPVQVAIQVQKQLQPVIKSAIQEFQNEGGSPYTILTLPSAGRLWGVLLDFSVGTDSTYTAGAFASAETKVRTQVTGLILAAVNVAVVAPSTAFGKVVYVSLQGIPAASGENLLLDVNGGTNIPHAQQRATGLILYSTP